MNINEIAKLHCDTEVLRTVLAANYCLELSKLDGIAAVAHFHNTATSKQRLWVTIKNFNDEQFENHMIINSTTKTVTCKQFETATGDIAINENYSIANGEYDDEVYDIKYAMADTPQLGMYHAAETFIDGLLFVLSNDFIDITQLLGDEHCQDDYDNDSFNDECADVLRSLGYEVN